MTERRAPPLGNGASFYNRPFTNAGHGLTAPAAWILLQKQRWSSFSEQYFHSRECGIPWVEELKENCLWPVSWWSAGESVSSAFLIKGHIKPSQTFTWKAPHEWFRIPSAPKESHVKPLTQTSDPLHIHCHPSPGEEGMKPSVYREQTAWIIHFPLGELHMRNQNLPVEWVWGGRRRWGQSGFNDAQSSYSEKTGSGNTGKGAALWPRR